MPFTTICQHYQRATYVYHEQKLLQNYNNFQQCIGKDSRIYYSVKANPNFNIIRSLHQAGAGMEVSSLYELHLATTAGVPPGNIIFLGPGKTIAEITACIQLGIQAIYCESLTELDTIEKTAYAYKTSINVVLRVANTTHGKGHQISMSGPNSQFGMDHDTITYINTHHHQWPCCQLLGIHYYHGSNQQHPTNTKQQITACCQAAIELAQIWHRPMNLLGLGLGVGILSDEQIATTQCGQYWSKPLSDLKKDHPSLSVLCEAGRCLVGTCGDLIAQVQYTKRINKQHWAILDTGYHHHMNLCFDNNFLKKPPTARVIKATAQKAMANSISYHLCGPLCTPSDRLHNNFVCQPLERGDFIVFEQVGAYALSHAPVLFLGHAPAHERWVDSNGKQTKSNTFERFFQFHYQGDQHATAR